MQCLARVLALTAEPDRKAGAQVPRAADVSCGVLARPPGGVPAFTRALVGFLLLTSLCACRRSEVEHPRGVDAEETHPGQDLPAPVALHESVLFEGERPQLPWRMALAAERIVVLDPYEIPKVYVVDARSGSLECAFGGSGGGPGEFRFPEAVAAREDGSEVWIGDPGQSRITRVAMDGICSAHDRVLETIPVATPLFRGLVLLDPGRFLTSDISGLGRLLIFDRSGTAMTRLGPPVAMQEVPPTVAGQVRQAVIALNRSTGLVALGGVRTGELEYYRLDGHKRATAAAPRRFQPRFRVGEQRGEPTMVPDPDDRYAYLDLAADDRYLVALFSGRSRREDPLLAAAGRDLHVFDWEGCLIAAYRLDQPISALAIDWRSRVLYGSRWGRDPALVRVVLPPFGRCIPKA